MYGMGKSKDIVIKMEIKNAIDYLEHKYENILVRKKLFEKKDDCDFEIKKLNTKYSNQTNQEYIHIPSSHVLIPNDDKKNENIQHYQKMLFKRLMCNT